MAFYSKRKASNTLSISKEAYDAADGVILLLAQHAPQHDYSSKRDDIARLIDDDIWNGNWDTSTSFDDGTPDIRLIQEDEYDQHMDDGDEDGNERPDSIAFAAKAGCYICLA